MFLATRKARCIRFQILDDVLRVFAGRDSSGVRGIRLQPGDEVNSLSVLNHVEATVEERAAYLKAANAKRRALQQNDETEEAEETPADETEEDTVIAGDLAPERFEELERQEEILLTVTDAGFGRRSSAYDYRVSGRGGLGIANMTLTNPRRGKTVVATMPVMEGEDIMMVTDVGRLVRTPVAQIRVMARQASGVTLARVGEDEQVAAVFPVMEDEGEDADADILPDGTTPPENGAADGPTANGAPDAPAVPPATPMDPNPEEG